MREKQDMHKEQSCVRASGIMSSFLLGLCAVLLFVFAFFNYEGPATGYWDSYIAAPALLMLNRTVDFTDTTGESLYTYTLPGSLPENLVDESTYGVASKDQRLGSAIMFAPFVLIWNL